MPSLQMKAKIIESAKIMTPIMMVPCSISSFIIFALVFLYIRHDAITNINPDSNASICAKKIFVKYCQIRIVVISMAIDIMKHLIIVLNLFSFSILSSGVLSFHISGKCPKYFSYSS